MAAKSLLSGAPKLDFQLQILPPILLSENILGDFTGAHQNCLLSGGPKLVAQLTKMVLGALPADENNFGEFSRELTRIAF